MLVSNEVVCPVCGKSFVVTDNHKYLLNGEHTCSWKCFSDYAKEHQKPKGDDVKKRGRPKKVTDCENS